MKKEELESLYWIYDSNHDRYYKTIDGIRYRLWNFNGRVSLTDGYSNLIFRWPIDNIDDFDKAMIKHNIY